MKILHASLHHIDHTQGIFSEIPVLGQSTQLSEYISSLFGSISGSPGKRIFYFGSENTEVRHAISLMVSGFFSEGSLLNSKRLLDIERKTQEKLNLNIEIQKGSLFQAVVEEGDNQRIIISKADHSEYLDEFDFELHKGLPWKKKIFKAIVVNFNQLCSDIESIAVYDTNSTMSKYWWQDYLGLIERYTDSENTKNALNLLDNRIFKPMDSRHPADYLILRNTMIGYFRTKEEFDIRDFAQSTLNNYQPVDEALSVDELKANILALPENVKHQFDSRFSIDKSSINKRIKKTIKLNEGIELVLDHVEGLRNIIEAGIDDEGNKHVKIRVLDESYKYFCR
jgi:hypothetical protein